MQTQTIASEGQPKRGNVDDPEYDHFLAQLNKRFQATVDGGNVPLFTTDAAGLYEAYLDSFPTEERQFHNCHACKHFIERYGSLVTIADGVTEPAIWRTEETPPLYAAAVSAMHRLTRRAKVTGVFISSLAVWGQPETGVWRHFAVFPPAAMVMKKRLTQTAGQAMAEKLEDHGQVMRALAEFTPATLDQALTLLKSEALYRSEKVLGQAHWLRELHAACDANPGRRTNIVWLHVATAPAGFCHPRSSMIGTLLEDIAAGIDFGDVSRKFAAKMHPLQYQRPQAAPSSGNIAHAEKVIAQLGAAGSLARRFARIEEIEALWSATKTEPAKTDGVFSHLKPKEQQASPSLVAAAGAITWEKFQRTVLADAVRIEMQIPSLGNFAALVTAENPDAPPILQWDTDAQRNPVSWYLYNGGSSASQWGVTGGAWADVPAITLQPSSWFGAKLTHQGEGVHFLLVGAKDSRWQTSGNGLFPEILKAEFREIRSTLEAYSRREKIAGYEESTACGIKISKGQPCDVRLRVTLGNGTRAEYRIDRFD